MRFLKFIVYSFLILIVISLGYIYLQLNFILKNAVENHGSEVLNAKVTLDDVRVNLLKEQIQFVNLKIQNPEGYDSPNLLEANETTIHLNLLSLFTNKVIIRDVIFNNPHLYLDLKGRDNNFIYIINSAKSSAKEEKIMDLQSPKSNLQKKDKREFLIQHFLMLNTKLHVKTAGIIEASTDIKEIHLKDIGKEEDGTTIDQIISQVLEAVYSNSISLNVSNANLNLKSTFKNVKEGLQQSFDKFME